MFDTAQRHLLSIFVLEQSIDKSHISTPTMRLYTLTTILVVRGQRWLDIINVPKVHQQM